ncbi:hypothetical protein AQ490_12100 [Wenjunlia vitaminophila]|uniref:ABM domain-containing protein n=1 Tax=Wenjunlia vitaminophila TaxID=76728 RepID=A0A0T6LL40_WENVI|nr:antibiotic biosynthesis monooxygenase [Wenjunlia vitaminophila]KRV46609.1 hypothetical protein AQ490_12100 [Wenjunlia vitaminophila]
MPAPSDPPDRTEPAPAEAPGPFLIPVPRSQVSTVWVREWTVDTQHDQQTAAADTKAGWQNEDWPAGVLSRTCLLGTDGDALLTFTQCSTDEFTDAAEDAVPYRLSLTTALHPDRATGLFVVVTTDVTGPQGQRDLLDLRYEQVLGYADAETADVRAPGLLRMHLLSSVDGTTLVSCAEWVDLPAHEAFLRSVGHQQEMAAIRGLAGVRAARFRRYRHHASLVRQ